MNSDKLRRLIERVDPSHEQPGWWLVICPNCGDDTHYDDVYEAYCCSTCKWIGNRCTFNPNSVAHLEQLCRVLKIGFAFTPIQSHATKLNDYSPYESALTISKAVLTCAAEVIERRRKP